MMRLYQLLILPLFFALFLGSDLYAQSCSCGGTVPTFTVNLTSSPDNADTINSTRTGVCCGAASPDRCIKFLVTVHPQATEIKITINPGNNGTYKIDCDAGHNPTDPFCLTGTTTFCMTYCNPGGSSDEYVISTSRGFSTSPDMGLRIGCTGQMRANGFLESSLTWTSVYPGATGTYNSYLSCTSACDTTYVTPTSGAPSYIDYKVCGSRLGCASGTFCDTVRVYTYPALTVSITPTSPVICAGGPNITLAANVSGGVSPYTYSWSPGGATTTSISAGVGTYTVSVRDTTSSCAAVTQTVTVAAQALPAAPVAGSNSTVCSGNTLSLTATSTGTTYSWNGPNSFTSTDQNPTIGSVTTLASGTYSVTATTNGCTGPAGTTAVVINQTPSAPTAGVTNTLVCTGQTLSLTTSTIAGASYSWSGPNGFTSTVQNPTRGSVSTADAGTYSVTATVGGCTGPAGTVVVSITETPAAPTATSNSPVCSGQTLSLSASTIASATYSWNGPNSFTNGTQNPTIGSVTTAASGTYSVTATVSGCVSTAGTTSVTINQTPTAPTAGSNSTVCSGQTLSLTASSTGTTYVWSGPNSFTSASQNPTIAGVTTAYAGTFSVTATTSGCTSSAGTTVVAINQTPAALSLGSNSTVCSGQTLSLTANTVGGGTYNWNGPNSFTSTLEDPTISSVTTAASGTYTASVTVAGCTSSAATVSVTVNPTPSSPTPVSSNSPVCVGATLNLFSATVASATYNWTGPNSFTSTAEDPSFTATTTAYSGTYSVTVTVGGCTSAAATVSVTVNPIPAAPTPVSSNSPVCVNATLNLTSATVASATYSWTGPNSFTSTAEDPSFTVTTTAYSGTYSVTVTVAGCTSSSATTSVTVNPTPSSPTPVSSNSPVCVGATLNLFSATVASATYNWTGPNSFTSTAEDPSFTATTTAYSGTYSVSVTVAGCTSSTATTSVTVNPIPSSPTPVSSNSPVCVGATLNLFSATVASATYNWTGPNSFTSTAEDPSFTATTTAYSGTYSVTVTVNGCTSSTATVSVTVNPTPSAPTPVSSNSPVCVNATLNLTSATVASATYNWTGPNSFTSTAEDPSFTATTTAYSGTYSVTVTVGGCTSAAATVSVTVNPIPAAPTPVSSNSPVCVGATLNLTSATVASATYSWTGPNSFTSTAEDPSFTATTTAYSGTYSVTVTVNGCTSSTATVSVTVNPTPAAPTAGSNSPLCTGTTLSLTASTIGGATYLWNGPNSFTSTSQNPTIGSVGTVNSGTYSVTVTVAGCIGPAGTTSVTISPPPAAPSAGSNTPVCEGTTLSLTANTIGGATYNWSGPNGFTSSLEDPTITSVTTAAGGTYSVSVTVGGCTGPDGTTSVTIELAPNAPTLGSNSPVCSGNTLSLTASTEAGVSSYSWSGPNSFTSTTQNPTIGSVTTAASGTYSLTAIAANGCGSTPVSSITVTITQTPSAPTAGSNSPVCLGGDLSLTASTITGASYNWAGPLSYTSTDQNPVRSGVTAMFAGTYSVTATVSGCTGPVGTTVVVVNAAPPAPTPGSNSPVCTGQTLSLTTATVPSGGYNWSGPNSFTSSLEDPTIGSVTAAAAGTYSLYITVPGCANSSTGTVVVTVNTTPSNPAPAGSNSPVCSGNNLLLTSATIGGVTYNWTGPNSFTSTDEDPVITGATTAASGTYSVTVTSAAGCVSTVTTTVATINQTPAAPTAGSNSPLCTGTTLSLTASSTGTTYSWSGPNSNTSTLQNPTFGPVGTADAGTYSVTATTSGCTSTAGTVSVSVTVPTNPSPLGSNTPVCIGQTINLTATAVASATYNWTGPNGFTSSSEDPSFTATTTAYSGTYSVTSTVSGCTGPVQTTSVVVNPLPITPSPSSNSPVCDGANLALSSNTFAGVTYSWSGPNGFTSTLEDPTPFAATTADAGTYTVSVTNNSTGCVSSTATVSVIINTIPAAPAPAGSNSPICSGQTLSLTATTVGGATYNWNGPLSYTSTQQNPSIASVTTGRAGTYSVTATVSGCTSPAATTVVTINQTPSAPAASASPNPVCDGSDVSLTASSVGSTYSWTGPGGYTSASQNPIISPATSASAGTYSVTATSAAGCTSPAGVVTVTVTPLPVAPTAGSNSPVCSGDVLSLTASTISGATYSWSGPGGYTSTLQNPSITGVSTAEAGTYSVSATVNGCIGPVGTVIVTINQTPSAPTAGSNSTVCSGQILSLTASTVGSSTYFWRGPNGFTSASQNPTISNVQTSDAGTYSVTATENGCTGPVGTTVVAINQTPSAPTAGSNSTVCSGNTLSLTASTISGATYSWSGPNGFTSILQNPTISNAQTSDAGTYTVNATVGGCTGPDATTVVSINETPAAPVAGSNSSICSGQTLSLTASSISGATYSWSGPLSFTSTNQNPTIASASTGRSGTYTVTASVGGCIGPAGTTPVSVSPTPTITATANTPVCTGNTLSLSATTVAGATYSWSGPGGFTAVIQSPTIPSVTSANAGNYSVTATSAAGCVGNTAVRNVVVTAPISISAGADQTVCANNLTTTLAGTVSGGTTTGIWSTSGSGGFIPGNTTLTGNYIPSSADTAAGTVTLTLTSTNNGGCTAQTDNMILTINDAPIAYAGADQTVCANNSLVSLSGAVNSSATGGMWTTTGSGTFSPDNITLTATYTPDAADTAAGSVLIMLTTTGVGLCSPATDTMIVTISNAPLVNAGTTISVCVNNPDASLNGASSTGSGTWTTLGSGSFTPSATTLNATYVPSPADTVAGSVILILTSTSNGNCNAEDDSVTVFYTPQPTVNAGSDVTVCANNATVTLSGTSSTSTGKWTTSGTGTFSPNDSLLTASYIPSTGDKSLGSVVLTLTTTNNGGCLSVADQMTITITPAPTANAGPNQTVCANNPVVTLSGSFTTATGAVWSSSGSGIFSPDNVTMSATYTPSNADTAAGSVTITLTTTGNGQCNAVTDVMVIVISNAPRVNAGINTVACKNNPNMPLNGTSSTGSGIWTTLGTGTFVPTATTLNGTYNSSPGDTTAGSVILILTSTANGGCLSEDDSITITYIDKPIVFSGNDTTVCSNNDTVYLNGSSNTGSGVWTTTGTGTFADSSLTSTIYDPSSGDISSGSIMIYFTSANNGTCNPVSDSMVVTFAPSPTANAGTDQTVCANNAAVTLSGSFTVSSGAGWTTLGSGTFSPDTFTMGATYTPSAADTLSGIVTIILTTTGNGGCLPERDTLLITINDAPTVNAGTDQLVCFSNLTTNISGTSTTGSGNWTTLGDGTFANSSLLSTTYTAGTGDTTAGSVQIVLTSTSNGLCNAVTDTVLLTFTSSPLVIAGTDQTVCANNATVTITGTSSTGAAQWTSSGSGTFAPNDSSLSATYTPSAGDISSGTVTIKLTSRYGCAPVSDSLEVTITPKPVVSAGPNQTICAGTMTASLNGSVSAGASTGQWTSSGSGTFSPDDLTLNATYNLSPADSAAGTVTLTLTSTNNGNCIAVSDAMIINVMQPPVADAGVDTSLCGIQLNLYGTITGGSGTGYWQTLDPNDGFFVPDSSLLNALFAPADSQATLILMSSNNGPCPASSDTMVVNIQPGPAANAGSDLFICKNNLVVQLNGSAFYAPGGQWSTTGTGTFSPSPDSLNAIYVPGTADTSAGSVALVLVTTGSPCAGDTDTVVVFFTAPPLVNAGADILVCEGDTSALLNGSVSAGASTGQWSTLGDGVFSPNDSTLNTTYILGSADTASGTITLVLSSTNNGNCLSTTDTVIITITPAPVVVAGNDTMVCANNSNINLNGSVTVGSTTGFWSTSGSGTFSPDSSAMNATYTPSNADTAAGTVTLTLTSTNGCRAISDSLIVTITNAPAVNAGTNISICEGVNISLNGTISGGATTGIWTTSGNGTFTPNDSSLSATYIPGSNDTNSVTLTLTSTGNGQCLAETDSITITIGRTPVAGFSAGPVCTGTSVSFTDTSSFTTDTIVSWDWVIDGIADTVQNPNYTYTSSGTDTVILIVTSAIGCTDTAIQVLNINASPSAGFTYISVCTSDSVFFTDGSTISGGAILSWSWNFGDGDTSSLQNPAHNYDSSGVYVVTLTVVSDSGCSSTFTDTVGASLPPVASFVNNAGCSLNVSFTDSSVVSPGDSLVSWNWNFGDTNTDTVQNPTHSYSSSGTYIVQLIVSTLGGCSDTIADTIQINPTPAASYTFSTSCAIDSVYFTDASSIAGGNIISWQWNFGDTNTSTLQNPVHYYDSAGVFIVSLTVTSDSGCTSTFTDTVIPVKAVITAFSSNSDCQFSVAFTDTSTASVGDSIISWNWNFGDGFTDTIQNPSHTYANTGTYIVTLNITTANGCAGTMTDTITIMAPPIADFVPQSGTYDAGTVVNFTDASTNATSWNWSFGDGTTDTVQNPSHQYNTNGTLDVTLIVTNALGCSDTATYQLIIKTNTVAVPTAFTPNGDGINDYLYVRGGPLKSMDFRIYNEWGNEIFKATDQSEYWDGKYKKQLQPAGRYVFLLKYVTYSDEEGEFNGNVTIIR